MNSMVGLKKRLDSSKEVDLLVGESPYVPKVLLRELAERARYDAAGRHRRCHRYADPRGVKTLRAEISRRYERLHHVNIDPESQVLVTQGATEAIWLSIFSLTDIDDEVVIADPSYLAFEPMITSLNRRPVRVRARPENQFILRPDDLEAVFTNRTKMLILASPDNPTGIVHGLSELEELRAALALRRAFLVHDEVYDSFVYEGWHASGTTLGISDSNTVVINSLSKQFGIGGWRLGWMVANPQVIEQATRNHANVNMSSATILQEVVAPVLNDPAVDAKVSRLSNKLRCKRDMFLDALLRIDGISCPYGYPAGGFYAFIDVRGLCDGLGLRVGKDTTVGQAVARYFWEQCRVLVGPGVNFGGAGCDAVRISFVAPDEVLTEVAGRLAGLV